MYEYFEQLLQIKGLSMIDVCKATGIPTSTISTWKKRRNYLRPELLMKIAKFLDCKVDDLLGAGNLDWNPETQELIQTENYYIDDDAREYAQFVFSNPEYRVLFDASKKVKKEDIQKALKAVGLFIED